MRDIIDTDRELIRLLLEDARRPYSELAEAVGLSPPAVSDRVDRLREPGVIERFSLDLDRSRLREGVRLAVTVSVAPGETATVRTALVGTVDVEHVFAPADARLIVVARVPDAEVDRHMATASRPGRSSPSTCRRWLPPIDFPVWARRRSVWTAPSAATPLQARASPPP
jgi:DNA-binding Lrp family transcriptional regulator